MEPRSNMRNRRCVSSALPNIRCRLPFGRPRLQQPGTRLPPLPGTPTPTPRSPGSEVQGVPASSSTAGVDDASQQPPPEVIGREAREATQRVTREVVSVPRARTPKAIAEVTQTAHDTSTAVARAPKALRDPIHDMSRASREALSSGSRDAMRGVVRDITGQVSSCESVPLAPGRPHAIRTRRISNSGRSFSHSASAARHELYDAPRLQDFHARPVEVGVAPPQLTMRSPRRLPVQQAESAKLKNEVTVPSQPEVTSSQQLPVEAAESAVPLTHQARPVTNYADKNKASAVAALQRLFF